MNGISIAIIEVLLFLYASFKFKETWNNELTGINVISYYWYMFTILVGFWEYVYITNYDSVTQMAKNYIKTKKHTWTNNYDITYVLPWKLSKIFYAEYGAWADREYQNTKNHWSRMIEGSHELCCGFFSLLTILFKIYGQDEKYILCAGISMGTQFMNSLLYMGNYAIQVKNKYNINYDSPKFPLGCGYSKRFFMWINYAWLAFPFYSLIVLLV